MPYIVHATRVSYFIRVCIGSMFWSLTAIAPALAQATATLTGTVVDESGGALPDAAVVATNLATMIDRQTATSRDGQFTMSSLPPGRYLVRVQRDGFTPIEVPEIVLNVNDAVAIRLQMKVAAIGESVSVVAEPPTLQETPQIGMSVTRHEYESLPMVQLGRIRSPAAFVLLAPGVQGTVRLDGAQNTAASNIVQVHGQANWTMEYLVEGLATGQAYGNLNESAPPVGGVQEFRVTTSQLTAEYGATGPAVASFVLRSGANQLHGDFYNYTRHSALDAKTILAATKPQLTLNEFGATLGGPITLPNATTGSSRSFFFFSYGGSRKRGADGVRTSLIPTESQRAGDFSELRDSAGRLRVIYDPATTRLENGIVVRDPFPGNIVPANRIAPAAAAIAALYPAPNSAGGFTGNFGEMLLDPNHYAGKVEHNLSASHRLSGAFIRTDIPREGAGSALPDPLQATGYRQTLKSWTFRVNDDVALSTRVLNSLAVGYNMFATGFRPATDERDWASALLIPGISTYAFPAITFGNGYQALGGAIDLSFENNTFLVKDALSWQRGAHLLKFGGEWRYSEWTPSVVGTTNGAFNFTNTFTANPAALGTTGDAFASFLLGGYQTASASGPLDYSTRWSYGGIFAQDDWRVTPSLTLTYGLRWEWQTPTREKRNLSATVDLEAPNPGASDRPGALVTAGSGHDDAFGKMDLGAIGPRAGFTWRLGERTGVRGGYGVYYTKYTPGPGGGIDTPGFQGTFNRVSTDNGLTPAGFLADGLPAFEASSTISPTLLNGQSAPYIDSSSWKLPRTQNWSVTLQRLLGSRTTVEASYVGLRGSRQNAHLMRNINQVDPKYLSLGALLTQSVTSPAAVSAGIQIPYPGFVGSVAQALRPYPQYQTLTSFYAKPGENTYNALELRLSQRLIRGVSFDVHYTRSRSEGYADTVNIGVAGVNNLLLDAYNPETERSLLPIDVPHALVASWIVELPGGGHRNAVVRMLAGGWTVAGVHRYQSGTPLQLIADNNLPLFNRVQRPNLISGVDPQTQISAGDFDPLTDRRINLAAFSAPTPFTFGNSPPTMDSLRNFAVLQEDLAVTKRITFGERWRIELYGQAFNLLNRQRFTGIVTNFSSPSFGLATGSSLPRYIQLGAKVVF
jgi:hypothetical protein